ncbi:MAG: hypothetical protein H6824_10265 [Planctomycetaceae bacterium]|nr:hypothetical protein [Planctomycetaceae bacterium]
MRPQIHIRAALLSLCALSLTGCYNMYNPYGPYGAGPYGSPYGAPSGGYVYPQQPGIQTLPPGQPYVPGSSNPGTFDGNGNLQPIPGAGAAAPGGTNVTVPPPYGNTGSPYMGSPTGMLTPDASEVSPASAARFSEPEAFLGNGELKEIPQRQAAATPESNPFASPAPAYTAPPQPLGNSNPFAAPSQPETPATSNAGNNPFLSPRPAEPPAEPVGAPFAPLAPVAPTAPVAPPEEPMDLFLSPARVQKVAPVEYGHHQDFAWLQGVVHKDAEGKASITYDDNPATEATYGGQLTLATSPLLNEVPDGTVVRIQGTVDPLVTDPAGKPVYVVSGLDVLTN